MTEWLFKSLPFGVNGCNAYESCYDLICTLEEKKLIRLSEGEQFSEKANLPKTRNLVSPATTFENENELDSMVHLYRTVFKFTRQNAITSQFDVSSSRYGDIIDVFGKFGFFNNS
uniref:Uncharacterized protein n=1 Tax=Glossina pallidipes TaxID=7398 RepID=A0A1B0A4Z3_GLOPL